MTADDSMRRPWKLKVKLRSSQTILQGFFGCIQSGSDKGMATCSHGGWLHVSSRSVATHALTTLDFQEASCFSAHSREHCWSWVCGNNYGTERNHASRSPQPALDNHRSSSRSTIPRPHAQPRTLPTACPSIINGNPTSSSGAYSWVFRRGPPIADVPSMGVPSSHYGRLCYPSRGQVLN